MCVNTNTAGVLCSCLCVVFRLSPSGHDLWKPRLTGLTKTSEVMQCVYENCHWHTGCVSVAVCLQVNSVVQIFAIITVVGALYSVLTSLHLQGMRRDRILKRLQLWARWLSVLAEDGAGRPSARLPNPAGPQTAFPRDPRGGSVTVPSAGITHIHTRLFLHVLRKVSVFIIHIC